MVECKQGEKDQLWQSINLDICVYLKDWFDVDNWKQCPRYIKIPHMINKDGNSSIRIRAL